MDLQRQRAHAVLLGVQVRDVTLRSRANAVIMAFFSPVAIISPHKDILTAFNCN